MDDHPDVPTKDEKEREARIDVILAQILQIHADTAKLIEALVLERDRPQTQTQPRVAASAKVRFNAYEAEKATQDAQRKTTKRKRTKRR